MGQVKRIYVEKKAPYAVRAKELKEEVRQYLGITALRESADPLRCGESQRCHLQAGTDDGIFRAAGR